MEASNCFAFGGAETNPKVHKSSCASKYLTLRDGGYPVLTTATVPDAEVATGAPGPSAPLWQL